MFLAYEQFFYTVVLGSNPQRNGGVLHDDDEGLFSGFLEAELEVYECDVLSNELNPVDPVARRASLTSQKDGYSFLITIKRFGLTSRRRSSSRRNIPRDIKQKKRGKKEKKKKWKIKEK